MDLIRRPGAMAIARAANGAFLLAASAYCLLAYSPFAYNQFIKPNVVPALNDFVAVSPWLFVAAVLFTALTLMPQLREGSASARWYVVVHAVVAAIVMWRPPLARVGNTVAALALGLAALAGPIALAFVDRAVCPSPRITRLRWRRALTTSLAAAVLAWASFAVVIPLRIPQAIGIHLPPGEALAGAALSLIVHLAVFAAVFVLLVAVRSPAALLWVGATAVLYLLVSASIAFTGRDAFIASAALAAAFVAIWMDIARLRARADAEVDPLALFAAPIVGRGRPLVAFGLAVALPVVAYALIDAVRQCDWNFLLQKLTVLIVWLAAFAVSDTVSSGSDTGSDTVSDPSWHGFRASVVAVTLIAAAWNATTATSPSLTDRYAAVDPAFRLIRDARTVQSSETVEYYAYLRSHTLLPPPLVPATAIDLVPSLKPGDRRPHIFLLIVDSLRRDYVSLYNPRVTFTPRLAELGADSVVFENAFTRYAGTALAVPSIWAGGLLPHMLDQPADFVSRNTLLKLLDANRYRRLMDLDHIVKELVPLDGGLEELDRGKGTMDVDVCGTTKELQEKLLEDRGRPAFFYSLPQNVHIAIAAKRAVPPGETYPAEFFDRTASSVRRVDGCIGAFVDFLKRERLYDDSVLIVTSDHGDSLGEEGRWGHAYFIYPEVMRIPLIVHVPSWMRSNVRADASGIVFSTDITPSLYALLGYESHTPSAVLGRSFFGRPDDDSSWRRREPFLVASSYGAVYGMLRDNGRQLYVVDAVDGSDYAFDLSRGRGAKVAITQAMTETNRRLIREQLDALAGFYRYHPPQ